MKFLYFVFYGYIFISCYNSQQLNVRNKSFEFVTRNNHTHKENILNKIASCLLNHSNIKAEIKQEITNKLSLNNDIKDLIKTLIVQQKEEVLSCFELTKEPSKEQNKEFNVKEYLQCLQENALNWKQKNVSSSVTKDKIENTGLIAQMYLALKTNQFARAANIEKELIALNNTLIKNCSIYHSTSKN